MAAKPDRKCMEPEDSMEGEACLGCIQGKDFYEEEMVTKILRKVRFFAAISTVMCVISLLSAGASVYLYYKTSGLGSEIKALSVQSVESDYYYDAEYLTDDPDYTADSPIQDDKVQNGQKNKRGRKKGNKAKRGCKGGKKEKSACKCCVRKVRSLINSGDISMSTVTKPPAPIITTPFPLIRGSEQKEIAAAHYSSFVTNDYLKEIFPPIDYANLAATVNEKNISEWGGILIRNTKHFELKNASTINMLKEAIWMVNATRIFDQHANGDFVAKLEGVYLLYAKVMFYDVKRNQSMELVHERTRTKGSRVEYNRLRCEEVIDPINHDDPQPKSNNYKPCSVNGVWYLKQGDIVRMQSLFPNSIVDLSKDVTYFGGVLFAETDKKPRTDDS